MNKEKEFRNKNNKIQYATDVFRITHTCWNVWKDKNNRMKEILI